MINLQKTSYIIKTCKNNKKNNINTNKKNG